MYRYLIIFLFVIEELLKRFLLLIFFFDRGEDIIELSV